LRLITTKGGLEETDRLVTVGGLTDQLIIILLYTFLLSTLAADFFLAAGKKPAQISAHQRIQRILLHKYAGSGSVTAA
jgi:hypothetical protein